MMKSRAGSILRSSTALLLSAVAVALLVVLHVASVSAATRGNCMQSSAVLSNNLRPVVFPVQVDFGSNGPRSYCFRAQFLDCTNPPSCTKRTTWRWIYGATDKASCEYLQMEAGGGAYRNVTCCNAHNCNAPNSTFDTRTEILPSDPATG